MHIILERIKISLYALYLNLVNRFIRHNSTKRVLIVFQQIIGDSVIFLHPLEEYVRFCNSQGLTLTLLCRPVVRKFWDSTAVLPNSINIRTIDFTKLFNDYNYFRTVVDEYRFYADIVIAPGSTLSSDLLSSVLSAERRIGMVGHKKINWPPQIALFQKIAFTEMIFPEKDMMMIQRHRMLLNYLGRSDFKGQIPTLRYVEPIIEGKYAVICPGSSLKVKCWPCDRFASVADWLIKTYKLDVYLVGGAEERKTAEELISKSLYQEKIHNCVGNTTFKDWLSIVQHSAVVIGNDSATLHIAAATRRKALCVAGVYDKYQFFPYKVDNLLGNQILPLTIIKDMPCEYCKSKGYFHGYGNKKCQLEIRQGRCALCLSSISKEEVIQQLKKLLN